MTTSNVTCADAEQSLGALVLGALEPQERDQVEAHVRSCPSCSSILTELAPLPGLLHRVDLRADELGPPPPALIERALDSVRTVESSVTPVRRRRWIPIAVGLAASVAVITVGLAVNSHVGSDERSGSTVIASGSSSTSPVKATIAMTPNPSGTQLALTLSGVTPGEHCTLVAVSHEGQQQVASSWIANYEGEAVVTGSTWLTLADIERLDITTDDGETLLQIAVPV